MNLKKIIYFVGSMSLVQQRGECVCCVGPRSNLRSTQTSRIVRCIALLFCFPSVLHAASDRQLQREIRQLQQQAQALQAQLTRLEKQMALKQKSHESHRKKAIIPAKAAKAPRREAPVHYRSAPLIVHAPLEHPESIRYYPTALVADNRVVTYIAGTPVVSSPYLGDRPAFDGSDYIVNISSINRDIRLMQQRQRLYRAYQSIGYPAPQMPIISISGKAEPVAYLSNPFRAYSNGDITLGSNELDIAAALNQNVEAYMAIAYDASPPAVGPRIDNSAFNLNMGFVNIGNLDKSPLYFTAGQLYVPFGRYANALISAPLTMQLARTKTRPFIFGYKSQGNCGPFAAVYVYRSDTSLGKSGVGGANLGYVFNYQGNAGEIDLGYIASINDAAGMQSTGSNINNNTFGGFGSVTNGNEAVQKTQAMDVNANFHFNKFNFYAEWVGAIQSFRAQDLSFNGRGAKPQAVHGEIDMTFRAFNRPSSFGVAYQWSKEALALNLPWQRYSAVFNISIWKDTVESLEYRHDIDYGINQLANGAAPFGFVNANTLGTGRSSDAVSAQIGVYF